MVYSNLASGALTLTVAVSCLIACESEPAEMVIAPETIAKFGTVNDRFLSYNVEMVEVTGGRFWRPYADGKREGDDRYEYRPARPLRSASDQARCDLGPAYVRFSGNWANATYFDEGSGLCGKKINSETNNAR